MNDKSSRKQSNVPRIDAEEILAGARHEDGRSAIKEMAKQILRLEDMTDYERGITLNVGMIEDGTGINVVYEHIYYSRRWSPAPIS